MRELLFWFKNKSKTSEMKIEKGGREFAALCQAREGEGGMSTTAPKM